MAEFDFRVSKDLEGGTYANLVSVWHTGHEFTVDFCSILQLDNAGDPIPARVVARVKLPVPMIFELLRAINANMTTYEETFGAIHAVQVAKPGDDDVERK